MANCGKKKHGPVNYDDERVLKNIASELVIGNIKFITSGYFTADDTKSIVAGTELTGKKVRGISFSLINDVDDEFKEVYNTGLLEGSFDKCIVDKMKLSSFKGELIYYNSKDFYLGTGGGDVYSYLINLVDKKVYYAHLILQKSTGASLFLSENIEDPILRRFFISYFKKDYGRLRILMNDVL